MAREELEIRVTDQIIYVYCKFLIVSDNFLVSLLYDNFHVVFRGQVIICNIKAYASGD